MSEHDDIEEEEDPNLNLRNGRRGLGLLWQFHADITSRKYM